MPTLESDSGVGLSPHSPGHVGVRAVEPAGDRLVGVPSTTQKIRAPDVTMKSENLRIALVENSEPHIDMTFAASVTELLPRLLPPRLRQKLDRRSINLPAIAAAARASDYAPGDLFRFEEGATVLRAWLE